MESLKCQSCILTIINAFLYNIGKPNIKIITDDDKIEEICKNNKDQILEIFYSNKEMIKKKLYKSDEIFDIKDSNNRSELPELFYLSSLLDDSNKVNFKYSFDLYKNLDNSIIKEKKYITQIILSKIIIKLIDNFKGLDYYYQYKKEIEAIKNGNIEKIKSNLKTIYSLVKYPILVFNIF